MDPHFKHVQCTCSVLDASSFILLNAPPTMKQVNIVVQILLSTTHELTLPGFHGRKGEQHFTPGIEQGKLRCIWYYKAHRKLKRKYTTRERSRESQLWPGGHMNLFLKTNHVCAEFCLLAFSMLSKMRKTKRLLSVHPFDFDLDSEYSAQSRRQSMQLSPAAINQDGLQVLGRWWGTAYLSFLAPSILFSSLCLSPWNFGEDNDDYLFPLHSSSSLWTLNTMTQNEDSKLERGLVS